jgi:hypothetical protein
MKQCRHQSERKWRKSGLQVHKDEFIKRKKEADALVSQSKADHFHALITEHEGNQKRLFQVVSKLLGSEKSNPLLQFPDPLSLAASFSDFFLEKVEMIRASIDASL